MKGSHDPVLRFWGNVDKSGGDAACWPWLGLRDRDGYGVFWRGGRAGRNHRAHRVSLEMAGTNPGAAIVLHSCDNPSCVNPAHLRCGTHTDNRRDCLARGRAVLRRGVRHPQAKLDPEKVAAIKAAWVPFRVTMRMLAEEHGVTIVTVWQAIHGKTWNPVPPQADHAPE